MTFLDRILETIARYRLFEPGDAVGVAVSGGADSLCLLHVLLELSSHWALHLAVIHVDHNLRGAQSREDAQFVHNYAQHLGLPFHLRTLEIGRRRGNLEQEGRHARYRFFGDLIREGIVRKVAVGHTRSDQAETVLYRLLRGSGSAGLAAIRPVTDSGIVRPLLQVTRPDVEAWLKERAIAWREDSTNSELRFDRNRIRRQLLPALAADWNPGLAETLAQTADWAWEEEQYWQPLLRQWMTDWVRFAKGRFASVADPAPTVGAPPKDPDEPSVAKDHFANDRLAPDRLSSDRLGPDRLGSDQLSPDRLGPDQLAADRLSNDRLSLDRLGSDRLDSDRLGSDRLSSDRLSPDRLDSDRLDSDRLGPVRLSPDRLGSDRLSSDRDRLDSDRLSSDRLSPDRLNNDRLSSDRLGPDQLSPDAAILDAARLNSLPVAAARRLIREIVRQVKGDLLGIDFGHIEAVRELAAVPDGAGCRQIAGLAVFRSFNWLRFVKSGAAAASDDPNWEFSVAAPGRYSLFQTAEGVSVESAPPGYVVPPTTIELELIRNDGVYNGSLDALDGERACGRLLLRNWRAGDRYRRQGHAGVEKVKKLFQEHHIPLWERQNWPIITVGSLIAWVSRFGPAAEFAASTGSRILLMIRETHENSEKV